MANGSSIHKSRFFFLENWQSAESWYRWNNIWLVYSTFFFYSLPVKTSPISACHHIVHSWYTNTPITGVEKKRCSRLLLLRLINIDNNFAFSIFKPSSNLFVLKKKKNYIFFLIYVYKYLNKINTFTVRKYYTSWYRYLGKYLLDRFFLKPFVSF
jgi:hypothetical protein